MSYNTVRVVLNHFFISVIILERRRDQGLKCSKKLLYMFPLIIGMIMVVFFTGFSKKNNNDPGIESEEVKPSATLGIAYLTEADNQRIDSRHNDKVRFEDKEFKREKNKNTMMTGIYFLNELVQLLEERPAGIERIKKDKEKTTKIAEGNTEKDSRQNSITQGEPKNDEHVIKLKRVALTFDDGPHPRNTEKVLMLLDQYDAKATFFMLGSNVEYYPDIVKKMTEKGHELGNHTWSHPDLTALGSNGVMQEVQDTNEIIEKTTGKEPTVFRPPYGATNDQVEAAVKMTPVLWSVDTMDWKSRDPNAILQIVKGNVEDGSIILLHDIHDSTVDALEPILKYLDEEGYNFVTISELEKY